MQEEELTFMVRGYVYEVFRILGAGCLGQVYHQALLKEFELQGLRAEIQRALEVTYKGAPVGLYIADIFKVQDRVVVELKVMEALAKAHEAQLHNYTESRR